ncbi:hypothetical protein LINPERPRIM_LOCUS14745, partial [Linum perenne]
REDRRARLRIPLRLPEHWQSQDQRFSILIH